MQISFDPLKYLDNGAATDAEHARKLALAARNAALKAERKAGRNASGFSLRGQLRPYAGLGIPDGRIRTVYYVVLSDARCSALLVPHGKA